LAAGGYDAGELTQCALTTEAEAAPLAAASPNELLPCRADRCRHVLDGGATVPFVARYRKEPTGALDDAQLRVLEERLRYLLELDERRIVKNTEFRHDEIDGVFDAFPNADNVELVHVQQQCGWRGVLISAPQQPHGYLELEHRAEQVRQLNWMSPARVP